MGRRLPKIRMTAFKLPSHPDLTSFDPLDVCGDLNLPSDPTHWQLIKQLLTTANHDLSSTSNDLTQWSQKFCLLLENIAYSLHIEGSLDVDFLKRVFENFSLSQIQLFWSSLVEAALSLEDLFPDHVLPHLSDAPQTFSPNQINALLAHLLLGTVQIPDGNEWGRPGFQSWFRSIPPIETTVEGYTLTLINYFIQGPYNQSITFTWSASDLADWTNSTVSAAQMTTTIKPEASEPSDAQDAFVLLSAHSQPGPGPSGTHEERLQGQSPALSICSLIAPQLPPDVAVITSPMPVHARWQGHNRNARLIELHEPDARPLRRYIIADAMELDSAGLADLDPRVIDREVRKLYAGFKGAAGSVSAGVGARPRVEAVPWGCQAFGGDLVVKAKCMMIAAGLAGVEEIRLLVTEDRSGQAQEINAFNERSWTVAEVVAHLGRQKSVIGA